MERRVALVTGASAGLGVEYARLFAAEGHDVVLVARREDALERVAEELRAQGVRAHVICADLSERDAPRRIVEATDALDLEIEFLVNNAGFGSHGRFDELDLGRELSMIEVNIGALMQLTHLYLEPMLRRRSGRILNVGSVAGFQAGPFMATYYASKAFVNHWTEALAFELRGTGVTATVSCPGATETEFAEAAGMQGSKLTSRGTLADAGEVALHGYRAMMAGKTISVVGWRNAALAQSSRVAPRSVVRRVAAKLNQP